MTRLKVSNKRFERPIADFDSAKYLKQSFGIWNVAGDESRHVVRVELKNYAARLCEERRWHPTQELVALQCKANPCGSEVRGGSLGRGAALGFEFWQPGQGAWSAGIGADGPGGSPGDGAALKFR
jgi:hypothetical protein